MCVVNELSPCCSSTRAQACIRELVSCELHLKGYCLTLTKIANASSNDAVLLIGIYPIRLKVLSQSLFMF